MELGMQGDCGESRAKKMGGSHDRKLRAGQEGREPGLRSHPTAPGPLGLLGSWRSSCEPFTDRGARQTDGHVQDTPLQMAGPWPVQLRGRRPATTLLLLPCRQTLGQLPLPWGKE